MRKVIKPGNEYGNQIKYIVMDDAKEKCLLLTATAEKEFGIEGIKELLKEKLPGYKIAHQHCPSGINELKFIWPQLVREIKERFSYAAGWLENARLELKDKRFTIAVESKLARKKIDNERIKNYLQNRLQFYLNKKYSLKIKNGSWLKENDRPLIVSENIKSGNNKNGKSNESRKVVIGSLIRQGVTHSLAEIKGEKNNVIIKGEIFKIKDYKTRNGKFLFLYSLTDKSDSIIVKVFIKEKEKVANLRKGKWLKVAGKVQRDKYNDSLVIMADSINTISAKKRVDRADKKRVELHLHTQMSAMDSVLSVEEAVKRASEWGHEALAITDHGVVQAFPEAHQAGEKYGVKIIYGLEAYLIDDGQPIIIYEQDKNISNLTYTVFDLETTGFNPHHDEIIEIGAVKIKEGKIIDEFSSLIKPAKKIPERITEVTGIKQSDVQQAPPITAVIDKFFEFIADTVLVAHNAAFDYGFLQKYFDNKEYPLLDTLSLSRALIPDLKKHKLDYLAEHLGIEINQHHRALADARATSEIFIKLEKQLKKEGIETLSRINNLRENIDWKKMFSHHTIILARNRQGLKDLYRMISESHLEYFYRKPRILKSKLLEKRENLLIGSACEAGFLFRALMQNKAETELEKLVKFYDYLEIQPLDNNKFLLPDQISSREELININQRILELGRKYNKPVVATGDVHFLDPEDKLYREILQTGQGFDGADQQPPLYFRTTEEMLAEFEYLGEESAREVVIENTAAIADEIEEIKPIPDGLYPPHIEGAEEKVRNMAYSKAREIYGSPLPKNVQNRIEKELSAIIDNGYAVIYLISHKLVKKSLEDGYLVGSRGSVGSSLVATMCGITEVNPLPPHYNCPECNYTEFFAGEKVSVGIDLVDKMCPQCGSELIKDGFDIPFAVFMGFEGDKVPDIDLNFSGEYQSTIHEETEKLFGRDYVFRAGTISTIADRTAYGFVKGYMDDKNLNLRQAEIDRLVDGCTGARKTTGQHPGGLMVVPRDKDIHDFSPIQHPANDQDTSVRTTHFDYHSISGRILKLDLLGHDDPTSLRMLQDLTGVQPDKIPLDDQKTMSIFSGTEVLNVSPEEIGSKVGTLGIPEFGTDFVRQMLVETKPSTFAELVRISGLSHGTDVWLNNARDLIRAGKAELADVISVRDDIMNYLINKGLDPRRAFWIMEHVRKGKGLTAEEEEYIQQFSIPSWYVNSCKKIKYMFPKAHAAAYVMMAFRIAYFKVHYPRAFYTTYFTTKATDFDALLVGRGYRAVKDKIEQLQAKGNDMTAKEKNSLTVLEIVIEAMLRGIEFTEVDLYDSDAFKFKMSEEGLIPPLVSLEGLGSSAAESIINSRQQGNFTSIEELVNKTGISSTVVEVMTEHGTLEGLPEKNQLSLF